MELLKQSLRPQSRLIQPPSPPVVLIPAFKKAISCCFVLYYMDMTLFLEEKLIIRNFFVHLRSP